MQKKIIVLAIASALTMPAMAMAAPTVYGHINVAYEMTDTGSNKANNVSSNFSRIGFKGSEDLSNGLTGIYQMEGGVDADDGQFHQFQENTFLGVSGAFGTVIMGNHDTPYMASTRGYDAFADSIADNRSMMLGDDTVHDVVIYTSPDFNGLSVSAAMVGKTTDDGAADGVTSLSASYARDNYSVVLATQTTSTGDNDNTATRLAASYNMDALTVGLIMENTDNETIDPDDLLRWPGTTNIKNAVNYLSAQYGISDAGTVKLAYTMAADQKRDGDTDADSAATQVSLGYDHAMTENTTLFASYTSITNGTVQYDLNTAGSSATASGGDPTAISVGLRHTF